MFRTSGLESSEGSDRLPFVVDYDYFKSNSKPAVSQAFMRRMQNISQPWIKPFSQRVIEFKYVSEYYSRPRYMCHGEDFMDKGTIKSAYQSERLAKRARQSKGDYELQSLDFDPKAFLEKYTDPTVVTFIEDVILLCLQVMRAKTMLDRSLAVAVFIKLRSGTSLLGSAANIINDITNDVFRANLQSNEELLEKVTDLRSLVDKWETIQHSTLVMQITKVYKYAIAIGVFSMIGMKIDDRVAYACKKELSSPMIGPNFMATILDTVAMLIQRALLFKKTNKWETFIHGPQSFSSWFDACQKVKREYSFRGDLEALGTSYHQFVGEIRDCVDQGKAILKYGKKMSGLEMASVKKLLNEVMMIQMEMSTYREAQKSRRPPFGLLVFGKTCVAKSTFTSMLFQFAGKLWKLPTTDEYKYTRNTCDEFWSGWDSMKWFLLLDDIAFGHPDSKLVDNSLTEVIQIMNDVPLVPNQASLEDKGKNPLRAKMVVATTNMKHLNAKAHFACPIATQRRFPWVITVSPKAEFARDDDPEMIDPAKLPLITDEWPNFWNILVEKVKAENSDMAKYEKIHEFSDSNDFLAWLGDAMKTFEQVQLKAGSGIIAMQEFELCDACMRLKSRCVCMPEARLEAREYRLPDGKEMGDSFKIVNIDEAGVLICHSFERDPRGKPNQYIKHTVESKDGYIIKNFAAAVIVTDNDRPKLQSDEIGMADTLNEVLRIQRLKIEGRGTRAVNWLASKYLTAYSRSSLVRRFTHAALEWKIARIAILKVFQFYIEERKGYYQWLAETLSACYMSKRWRMVVAGLTVAVSMIGTYGLYKSVTSGQQKIEVQGLRQSVQDGHFQQTEKPNVWKRDDYQTSVFDRSAMSASLASLDHDQIVKIIERNTARIKVSNGVMAREGNTFSPCGHLWMTNNHTLFAEGDLSVTLSIMPEVQGSSPNVTIKLRQEDILRVPERDVAFFEVHSWETKRDLRELIRKPSLQGAYTATYVTKTKGIGLKLRKVKCAVQGKKEVPELGITLDTWTGFTSDPTVVGDCGSPLFTHQPVAVILGIHSLGNAHGSVWATEIDQDLIAHAVKHFDMPVVQCAVPVIGAPSRQKRLTQLSQYSPLRWLEQGTVNVYGSYAEPRFTSRSKVRPTLLSKKILESRKWVVDFKAPILRDYRPWRHALIDSTQKKFGALGSTEMKAIAKAYADDILDGLTKEDLSMLEPLSDRATINGIDGVRFIDKMNFKSSMGEPYNETKKLHLKGTIGDMTFDDEVWERIEEIRKRYSNNQRACPVFSGQLKDEPRATAKVDAGKVRVFTAAPADWSFVVRQNLLPVVKLIQEHPFLFEASPGCTVQSLEWQQYYDYLTHFGVDRMVAGDYGKFDKRMEALIILLAFQVLKRLYLAAGWSKEQAQVIDCIAEDTAYAYVNFNGDLIEFLGSNPSGHPLTVIVNCIANALYMRFAFVKLCPFSGGVYERARRFKEFVRLLTYGDDNAMGVSKLAPWFNHTAIQRAMAHIGVEYTMADKESESVEFIHISQVSYLKRTWRWDEDIGAVVAPLEESSIHKMLTICNPSGEESPELHMASVMNSALNEWFWYGKERFNKERVWLMELARENDLMTEFKFKGCPTWDELNDRFWHASQGLSVKVAGCEAEHPRNVLPK